MPRTGAGRRTSASRGAHLCDFVQTWYHDAAVPGEQQQRYGDRRKAVEEEDMPTHEIGEGDDGEGPHGRLGRGIPPTTLVRSDEDGEEGEQQDGIEGVDIGQEREPEQENRQAPGEWGSHAAERPGGVGASG